MYLEDIKIPEIARALDVQGVQTPQVQMAKRKRSRTKNKWQDSTIRSILKNPLYIGKCTLTLAKAKRELEVPAIVSKTEFQKAQKKLESTRFLREKRLEKNQICSSKKSMTRKVEKVCCAEHQKMKASKSIRLTRGIDASLEKPLSSKARKSFERFFSFGKRKNASCAYCRVLDLNPEKVKQCMVLDCCSTEKEQMRSLRT